MSDAGDLVPIDAAVRRVRRALLASVVLVVAGARLWMIGGYGSDLPFWDQWDAEAERLFLPYFSGSLRVQDWFAPHNEHRIPLTRLLSFALMRLDGQWDARVQMAVNALLAAGVAAALLLAIARDEAPHRLPLWAGVVALLFALPFGWENTLSGFQSQFYLLAGFSVVAMVLLASARAWTPAWLGGLLAAVGALLSMGSGLVAALSVLIVLALRVARERPPLRVAAREVGPTAVACAVLVAAGAATTVTVAQHASLRAHSAGELGVALGRYLAWPLTPIPLWAPAAWLPACAFLVAYLRRRVPDGPRARLVLALAAWSALQAAALAVSRARAIAPRYSDVLVLGLLANVLAATPWLGWSTRRERLLSVAFAAWVAVVGVGLERQSFNGSVTRRGLQYAAQRGRTAAFVETGDPRALAASEPMDVPYHDVRKLADLLQTPSIRAILPASVEERPALAFPGQPPDPGAPGEPQAAPAPDVWERTWVFRPDARGAPRPLAVDVTRGAGRPWLLFYVRGDAGSIRVTADGATAGSRLALHSRDGAWRPVLASCATRVCTLSGGSGGDAIAITEPREIGTLGAIAFVATWDGVYLLAAGVLVALAASLWVAVSVRRARAAAPTIR